MRTPKAFASFRFRKLWAYKKIFGARNAVRILYPGWFASTQLIVVRSADLEHPVCLRPASSDPRVFVEVITWAAYDVPLAATPRVIIDIGANIGLAATWFASRYPQARVIAVEPEPANFYVLRTNAAPYPNIEVLRAAIWNKSGDIAIVDPGTGSWGFQSVEMTETSNSVHVAQTQAITMGELLAQCELDYVDVLKIDIEGAEMELFENIGDWIDHIGMIVIELHDRIRPGCTAAFTAAVAHSMPVETNRGGCVLRYSPESAPSTPNVGLS